MQTIVSALVNIRRQLRVIILIVALYVNSLPVLLAHRVPLNHLRAWHKAHTPFEVNSVHKCAQMTFTLYASNLFVFTFSRVRFFAVCFRCPRDWLISCTGMRSRQRGESVWWWWWWSYMVKVEVTHLVITRSMWSIRASCCTISSLSLSPKSCQSNWSYPPLVFEHIAKYSHYLSVEIFLPSRKLCNPNWWSIVSPSFTHPL